MRMRFLRKLQRLFLYSCQIHVCPSFLVIAWGQVSPGMWIALGEDCSVGDSGVCLPLLFWHPCHTLYWYSSSIYARDGEIAPDALKKKVLFSFLFVAHPPPQRAVALRGARFFSFCSSHHSLLLAANLECSTVGCTDTKKIFGSTVNERKPTKDMHWSWQKG